MAVAWNVHCGPLVAGKDQFGPNERGVTAPRPRARPVRYRQAIL